MKHARPATLIAFLFFHVTFSLTASAQSIAPDVLAPAGNSDHAELQWTLGELAVATHDNAQHILTEGFHQTKLVITGIKNPSINQLTGIEVYPNPTAEVVFVQSNNQPLRVEVFDVNGKLLFQTATSGTDKTEIDLTGLAASTYLLKVFSENRSAHYRIQKINR